MTVRRIGQGIIGGALAIAALGAVPGMASAADRLPDLGMARLTDFKVDQTSSGRRVLRYTTVIVNVGSGPFEARGQRSSTSQTQMAASQRIYDTAGGSRDVSTTAVMVFGGDGHNHWHVRDLESSDLIRLDNGSKVGTGAKHGFCFFDNYRYGSNRAPFYTTARGACGDSSSDLRVRMGLSRGWGDIYKWNLPGQYINVTGLSPGRYRLKGVADPAGWFRERNNANNSTWVNIQLARHGVRVLKHGPSA